MAPTAYVLWHKFLRFNPRNPKWFGRDRFLLSAGHGSMLLYSLLFLFGFDLKLEDIKRFRQLDSITPGHPENVLTPGVEVTTGPLGQGFANGVGMAIAEAHLAARFNRPGFKIIDSWIYAIVSDGDLMEGVSYEAASLAGHLRLEKLIYLYDDNQVTIDGPTSLAFSEDVSKRFEAAGWSVLEVSDGNDTKKIEKAIREAQRIKGKPKLIKIKSVIGYGMPTAGTSKAHSDAPGEDAVRITKRNLNLPEDKKFYVSPEVLKHLRQAVKRGPELERRWSSLFREYSKKYPQEAAELKRRIEGRLSSDALRKLPAFTKTEAKATRAYSGEVINSIADVVPELIGGSADLTPSNNTYIKTSANFAAGAYQNRNIHFGIREHAMGAALNGMALFGGLIPFAGTFQTFSDYMRPSVRLAALSDVGVIFVYTHDSIGLGEDGPTHQSVEHLAALRAIPNLAVIRPCDAAEVREAWRAALQRRNAPTALSLSRQKVAALDRRSLESAKGLHRGAYILAEAKNKNLEPTEPELILIASGSEVGLALSAAEKLNRQGIPTRVVSMPCWEFFEAQSKAYQEKVLPGHIKARIAVEAGVSQGWHRYIGEYGGLLTVDRFGKSAPADDVFRDFGFTENNLISIAKKIISRIRKTGKNA
jgi:transketolase